MTVGTSGVLSAGGTFTCVVANGGAWCWGDNGSGQLGNSSLPSSKLPLQVQGLSSGVQAIAAGDTHACALVNGGVECWGDDSYGEVGNRVTSDAGSPAPVAVQGLSSGAQALAAGEYYTCALVNGGVWCWGDNSLGQLGSGSDAGSSLAPVVVQGLAAGVQALTAGSSHGCALLSGGVQCWGTNATGQLGNGTTALSRTPVDVQNLGAGSGVQAIAAGETHTCALVNGGAQCWGDNAAGELGDNSTVQSDVPVAVQTLGSGVAAVAAGTYFSCAVVSGGAECWGDNSYGELGSGAAADAGSPVPVQVEGLGSGVQAIAARNFHACALVNGSVHCWGDNGNGDLGNGSAAQSNVPVAALGLAGGVQALTAGEFHTCALVNGGVQCWGANFLGQLGNESGNPSYIPVVALGLGGVQAVAAGGAHTCALVSGGVRCWGSDDYGQLGDGRDGGFRELPFAIQGLGALGSGVQALAAGEYYTCALVNGGAQCWGADDDGQLGSDLDAGEADVPVQVQSLGTGVQALAAGYFHTCALTEGVIQCWGDNPSGGLGDGVDVASIAPVQVTAIGSGAQAIAAGYEHTCAVVNGAGLCWGDNTSGQLGNGTTTDSPVPVAVQGLDGGVQAIAAGNFHSCALVNGSVQCWGDETYGQLGNGVFSVVGSSVPVGVQGLQSGVEAIAARGNHTCALVSGAVWCWGQNNEGQLGDGSDAGSAVPVPVAAWGQ